MCLAAITEASARSLKKRRMLCVCIIRCASGWVGLCEKRFLSPRSRKITKHHSSYLFINAILLHVINILPSDSQN